MITSYPPKPTIEKKASKFHFSVTVLSIIFFALTFSLIVDDYVFIASILAIVLIHELGHFLCMKFFGYKKVSFIVIPFFGGLWRGYKKRYSQKQSIFTLLAGPIPGIILGYVFFSFGLAESYSFFLQVGVVLMGINFLNLIPLEPFDGGKLIRAFFRRKYNLIQLVIMSVFTLGLITMGFWMDSWLAIGLGIVIGWRTREKYKMYKIHSDLNASGFNYEVNYEDLSDQHYADIKEVIIDYRPVLKDIEAYNEKEKFNQILARQVERVLYPPMARDATKWHKIIFLLVWVGAAILAIFTLLNVDYYAFIDAFQ
ncbi:MAG: site-2 protease family protein [Bacteroidota bacterium]